MEAFTPIREGLALICNFFSSDSSAHIGKLTAVRLVAVDAPPSKKAIAPRILADCKSRPRWTRISLYLLRMR
jgi:hypothetical protein